MVANTHLQFSLQHHFFDALLDKVSGSISAEILTSSHQSRSFSSHDSTITANPVVYLGANIYKRVGEQCEKFEALLVCSESGMRFSSLENINAYLKEKGITASFVQLDEQQAVFPSFCKRDYSFVLSALLQQWFNFGPFGFHVEWLTEMPNYNANYIAKALLYIDKSLSTNEWLLGYGVHSKLIPKGDTEPSINCLVNQLDLCRPIVILDAHAPIAYINDIAAELIFDVMSKRKQRVFKSRAAFDKILKEQGGLFDEQLLWLVEALPYEQIQQHAYRIMKTIDDNLQKCCELGITHLFLNDNHVFSQSIIDYYQSLSLPITIEQQQFNRIDYGINKARQVNFPFEPLSPMRILSTSFGKSCLQREEAVAELSSNFENDTLRQSKATEYLLLSHDPMTVSREDILHCKVLKKIS